MSSEKVEIKNRHGLKLVIQIDTPDKPTNLAFIAHGQGGRKDQKHIQAFARAFLENNFRVVRFDATHSIGESDGDIFDVTYTGYIEDLEDIIEWSKSQDWFQKPFALLGHSMGGLSTCWYAEHHSKDILCLAPLSAVINYDLYEQTPGKKAFMKTWKDQGYFERYSHTRGGINRIGWGVAEDLKKYDLLKGIDKLNMPVLFMASSEDESTPYNQQKILYDKTPSKNKKLVKIENANHSFINEDNVEGKLEEVKSVISDWLKEAV